jgi:hypothetical protein
MKEKHIGGDESKGIFYRELEVCSREDARALARRVGAGSQRVVGAGEKGERKVNPLEQPGYIATVTARRDGLR